MAEDIENREEEEEEKKKYIGTYIGKLEIDGQECYNHNTIEAFENNEFKTITEHNKEVTYGSVYLYDRETKVKKKAWVKVANNYLGVKVPVNNYTYYLIYKNDVAKIKSVKDIFEEKQILE